MSKETYYFSHDANARRDPKIIQMMAVYGFEGYGWYWAIIEMLREEPTHKLDITGKYFYQGLANELSTTVERSLSFVEDCVGEFKLFKCDDIFMWSESLKNRMKKYQKLREQRSLAGKKSAQKRMKNKKTSTSVERALKPESTVDEQIKESKVNKSKEEKEKTFARFWELYPKRNGTKVGKQATKELFMKMPESEYDSLLKAVENYSDSKGAADGYAKDPERFLKKDFWRDWVKIEKQTSVYKTGLIDEIEKYGEECK